MYDPNSALRSIASKWRDDRRSRLQRGSIWRDLSPFLGSEIGAYLPLRKHCFSRFVLSALPSLSQPRHPKANISIIVCSRRPNSHCRFESQPGRSGSSPRVMLGGSGKSSAAVGPVERPASEDFPPLSPAVVRSHRTSEQRRRARAQIRSGRGRTCPPEREARKSVVPRPWPAREAGFVFRCRLPRAISAKRKPRDCSTSSGRQRSTRTALPGVTKLARRPASSSMPAAGTIRTIVFSKGIG